MPMVPHGVLLGKPAHLHVHERREAVDAREQVRQHRGESLGEVGQARVLVLRAAAEKIRSARVRNRLGEVGVVFERTLVVEAGIQRQLELGEALGKVSGMAVRAGDAVATPRPVRDHLLHLGENRDRVISLSGLEERVAGVAQGGVLLPGLRRVEGRHFAGGSGIGLELVGRVSLDRGTAGRWFVGRRCGWSGAKDEGE